MCDIPTSFAVMAAAYGKLSVSTARQALVACLTAWPQTTVPFNFLAVCPREHLVSLMKLVFAAGHRVRSQLEHVLTRALTKEAAEVTAAAGGDDDDEDGGRSPGGAEHKLGYFLATQAADDLLGWNAQNPGVGSLKPVSVESRHPYANSFDSGLHRVEIPGASGEWRLCCCVVCAMYTGTHSDWWCVFALAELMVTFDTRCSMEQQCDVLSFYADASARVTLRRYWLS